MPQKIQIKRSATSASPLSLDPGELAYSEVNQRLYIGETAGFRNLFQQFVDKDQANVITGDNTYTGVNDFEAGDLQIDGVPVTNGTNVFECTILNSSTDLNTLTQPGGYLNDTESHATFANNYPKESERFFIEVISASIGAGNQVSQRITTNVHVIESWIRNHNGGSWGAWRRTTSSTFPGYLGDLNNITETSKYLANSPTGNNYPGTVAGFIETIFEHGRYQQTFSTKEIGSDFNKYFRGRDQNGFWSDWKRLVTDADLAALSQPTAPTFIEDLVVGGNIVTNPAAGGHYIYNLPDRTATFNLPSTPAFGDTVRLTDVSASGSRISNNITITRGGELVMGLTEDLAIASDFATTELTFVGGAIGWAITSK